MSRRKPVDPKILEASKNFDARLFADTIRGDFSGFPDYRRNQKRVLYPVWQLTLVILCGFFCGCNTIEEIVEYGLLLCLDSRFEVLPMGLYGGFWSKPLQKPLNVTYKNGLVKFLAP